MGFVGAAVGAAMTGLRPIVEIMFVDLIGVCYDQIINQAAKMHYMMGGRVRLPLVIRTAFGSRGDKRTYGGGAAAQHSQTLYAVLAHVPGLKVVVPSTAYNAKGLLIAAIRDDGPVVVMEHKFLGFAAKGHVPEETYTFPIGKAEIVRRGSHVTLCGIGRMTHICLEAAERLAEEGIDAEVVDVLTHRAARRGDDLRVGAPHAPARRRGRGHPGRLDGTGYRRSGRATRRSTGSRRQSTSSPPPTHPSRSRPSSRPSTSRTRRRSSPPCAADRVMGAWRAPS